MRKEEQVDYEKFLSLLEYFTIKTRTVDWWSPYSLGSMGEQA